ncbi:alpha-mannosidase [Tieghemostelium lacteum]|uniref:Alpha-mannosidase n=1 Tax=Tieghemostelium lacteum TaxID=361077 RepID=A0A151ZKX6_TIELA|nr:alpha-mannosidase [Tieghemostelium lacteum]|eukprot:KYQ94434.1 alpha-mannosidase [Tieghemostelium lacteum]
MKEIKYLLLTFLFLIIIFDYTSQSKSIKINNNNIKEESSNNGELISAFLIPHSHCDVGWLETYEQYYAENVSLILDNVVNELTKDSSKKFNWAEVIYFQRWWYDQNAIVQAQTRQLIAEGRLYFIGGGWAQNDEAVTHYQAVINQMTIGHQFLLSEFGVTPTISWQIDPFGASTLTPILFSLMGIKYSVIDRLDQRLKYNFSEDPFIAGSGSYIVDKSFEFNWYPSKNYGESLNVFTHILDNHYNSPQYCYPNVTNPNITICTGFDFESDIETNPPINETNINERANVLVNIIKERQAYYRHQNILLPFGNDFEFQNSTVEFENMDKLIEYINSNTSYGVYIQYATLNEYFDKVMSDVGDDMSVFPDRYADDYFTYTKCLSSDYQSFNTCINYWSGFFTSYPLMKQTVRESDWLLRSVEILYSLASNYPNGFDNDLSAVFYALYNHRNSSGILTHHDAITGTSKFKVRENYFDILYQARNQTYDALPVLIEFLLANKSVPANFTANPNILLEDSTQPGTIYTASFSNSLAWQRSDIISVPIAHQDVAVFDYHLNPVPSQIIQRMDQNGQWYLYFNVEVPPLGISTYFISILSNDELERSRILKDQFGGVFKGYQMAHVSELTEISQDLNLPKITISNTMFNLNFQFNSQLNGILKLTSYDDLVRDIYSIPLSMDLIQYFQLSDDAYKFRPKGLPTLIYPESPQFYMTEGPLLSLITVQYTYNCSITYIVYNQPVITNNNSGGNSTNFSNSIDFNQFFEIQATVASGWDQEISMRFNTSISNNQSFYTNNGFEMMERQYQVKFNDTYIWSLISGNFYPIINQATLNDQQNQLTILTQESHAGSSQLDGTFEILLIRRSNYTQSSIHETLNDTSNPTLRFRVFFGQPTTIELIRTPHSIVFENPLLPVFGLISTKGSIVEYMFNYNTQFSPLKESLPMNVHMLSLNKQYIESPGIIMRIMNIYEIDQNSVLSQPASVSLNEMLSEYFTLSSIYETTLSANSILSNATSNDITVTLNPIQLKTYIFNMQPLNQKQKVTDDKIQITIQ